MCVWGAGGGAEGEVGRGKGVSANTTHSDNISATLHI